MRHLWSLVLALVLTPLIYIAAGVCAVRLSDARGLGGTAVVGLVAALVAGGLYAVLVMARLSPVGPVAAGLIYLGVTIWALVDRSGFQDFLPADIFAEKGALHRPVGMGTALLAGPLLITLFSPSRWRGTGDSSLPYDAAPVYPTAVPSAAPTYTDAAVSAAPVYPPPSITAALPEAALPEAGTAATTYEPPVYTPPSGS